MSNIFRISDRRKPRDKIASENKVVSLGFTVTTPYFSTLSHMYALVGYRFGLLVSNKGVFLDQVYIATQWRHSGHFHYSLISGKSLPVDICFQVFMLLDVIVFC